MKCPYDTDGDGNCPRHPLGCSWPNAISQDGFENSYGPTSTLYMSPLTFEKLVDEVNKNVLLFGNAFVKKSKPNTIMGYPVVESPFLKTDEILFGDFTRYNTFKLRNVIMPESPRTNILDSATRTVNSDRQAEYGDPVENRVREAIIATVVQGKAITPNDVVQVFSAQKMVRSGKGKNHEDSNVDQAGYAEIRDRVQKATDSGEVQNIVRRLLGGWVRFNTENAADKAEILRLRNEVENLRRNNEKLLGVNRDLQERNSNQYKTIVRLEGTECKHGKEIVRGTFSEVEVDTRAVVDNLCFCGSINCRRSKTSDRYKVTVKFDNAEITSLTSSELSKQYALVEVK